MAGIFSTKFRMYTERMFHACIQQIEAEQKGRGISHSITSSFYSCIFFACITSDDVIQYPINAIFVICDVISCRPVPTPLHTEIACKHARVIWREVCLQDKLIFLVAYHKHVISFLSYL